MVPITGNVENELFTCPNDAAIGDAVYVSASETVAYADVSDAAKFAQGVIWHKITATTCKIRFGSGIIHTSGLTPADVYYLTSTATTGNTLSTAVSAQRIGIAISATKLLILGFQAYSTDGTLAGDSDIDVPTEKATKTYVDTAAAPAAHSHSDPEIGDDHTHTYTASETIQLNNAAAHTTLTITNTDGTFNANLDVEGNIVVGGTVDGVDIAARDHAKYVLTEDLASGEISQLQNINATTITTGQWGYVGGADQSVRQADSPTFVGLTLSGAIATPTNISMTGELDLTGVNALIDLNPANTSGDVINLTPTAQIAAGSTWRGINIVGTALNPLTGAVTTLEGIHVNMSGIVSDDGDDASVFAYKATLPTGDTAISYGFFHPLTEQTVGGAQVAFASQDTGNALSTTATYRGLAISWDNLTADAGSPVLEGIRSELPANYASGSGFGASFAGYFSGDGRAVTICDTTYALDISGDMKVTGTLTTSAQTLTQAELDQLATIGATTISAPQWVYVGGADQAVKQADSPTFAGLTVTNAITEFSTDGTMAGDSDAAVPTEKATKTYVDGRVTPTLAQLDDLLAFGSGNAAWFPCVFTTVGSGYALIEGTTGGFYDLAGSTNFFAQYMCLVPVIIGTLKFYMTSVKVILDYADGDDYVDYVIVAGVHNTQFHAITHVNLATNLTAEGAWEANSTTTMTNGAGAGFTAIDCSDNLQIAIFISIINSATADDILVRGLHIKGYYA